MKRPPKLSPRDEYFPQQLHRIHERARMARLTVVEFGVYRFLIDTMWMRWERDGAGELENDPHAYAGQLKMNVRTWNATMRALVAQGLFVVDDGWIRDAHTAESIAAKRTYARERKESGSKGGRATQRNRSAQAFKDAARAAEVRQGIETRAVAGRRETPVKSRETFSTRGAASRENGDGPSETKSLAEAQLQAEPLDELQAIHNTEYNQLIVEPQSARAGQEGDAAFAEASAAYRRRWEALRNKQGEQGALKLGPVVVADNTPSSGEAPKVADTSQTPKAAAS